jgi:energy-coupling factor transporter transmembrane protein EcfT
MARCYTDSYGRRRCYRSAWDNWVRWVVLAVVVIGFFLLFMMCR